MSASQDITFCELKYFLRYPHCSHWSCSSSFEAHKSFALLETNRFDMFLKETISRISARPHGWLSTEENLLWSSVWERAGSRRACVGVNAPSPALVLESVSVMQRGVGGRQHTDRNTSISGEPQLSSTETWTGGPARVLTVYVKAQRPLSSLPRLIISPLTTAHLPRACKTRRTPGLELVIRIVLTSFDSVRIPKLDLHIGWTGRTGYNDSFLDFIICTAFGLSSGCTNWLWQHIMLPEINNKVRHFVSRLVGGGGK